MRLILILLSVLFVAACEPASLRSSSDEQDVTIGTILPFGQIGRVCEITNRKQLGRRLEKTASLGRGFALYDSNPQSRRPHTFYITGFKDRCARQFTASVAVFGSPEMYEQLHYGTTGQQMPKSIVDKAYETVKARVCKVRKNKPCGNNIKALKRNTVFISTYETFSGSGRWADILLHNGEVAAHAVKGP